MENDNQSATAEHLKFAVVNFDIYAAKIVCSTIFLKVHIQTVCTRSLSHSPHARSGMANCRHLLVKRGQLAIVLFHEHLLWLLVDEPCKYKKKRLRLYDRDNAVFIGTLPWTDSVNIFGKYLELHTWDTDDIGCSRRHQCPLCELTASYFNAISLNMHPL